MDVQDLSDQLKMNSFNTGEPENSGLSRTQLMDVSQYGIGS